MFQFYLLSIVALVWAGLLLASDWLAEKFPGMEQMAERAKNSNLRYFSGIGIAGVGLFKLFLAVPHIVRLAENKGRMVMNTPVLDDLLPVLFCLFLGGILILDSFYKSEKVNFQIAERLGPIIQGYKQYLGLFAFLVAFLHFVLGGVLIF